MSAPPRDLAQEWERAEDLFISGKRLEARCLLESIVATPVDADDADGIRAKEQAVYRLGEVLAVMCDGNALTGLLLDIRSFFDVLPKAKTTKLVRKLFVYITRSKVSHEVQRAICISTIQWARQEKRTFLRHRLQLRLAELLFEEKDTRGALGTLNTLLREVRRLDDRALLLDIHLLESKIYYAIRNSSKARAALVAARTTANSIYCPPLAQAEIDLQSGVLHTEEHDPKTAYSYLYEAFEGFHQLGDQALLARKALRYMILAKVATDSPDELSAMFSSKHVLEYSDFDISMLRKLADAYSNNDTHQFNDELTFQKEIMNDGENHPLHDEIVLRQLEDMYDTLMERHLLKVIQPYNRVQISYLASLLSLSDEAVEARVSQLILDKKLSGIVDQQNNCLVVFDEVETANAARGGKHPEATAEASPASEAQKTTLYEDALTALESYDKLVTALFDKVSGKFDALVEENLAKRGLPAGSKAAADKGGSGETGAKANGGDPPPGPSGGDSGKEPGDGASGTEGGEKR